MAETEPNWEIFYSKYDKKLVTMFQQFYELKKCYFFSIKCSRNFDDASALLKEGTTKSNNLLDRITAYAPTPESMPMELLRTVIFATSKFSPPRGRGCTYPSQNDKISQQIGEEMKRDWIASVRSGAKDEDFEELEKIKMHYGEKYGAPP